MDGFPNFFMIFGPNTATGHSSVILASENMVNYSLQFVKQIINRDVNTVEVKREAEEAYTADVQKSLKHTVWMDGGMFTSGVCMLRPTTDIPSGCSSWYYDKNGWNASVFPSVIVDTSFVVQTDAKMPIGTRRFTLRSSACFRSGPTGILPIRAKAWRRRLCPRHSRYSRLRQRSSSPTVLASLVKDLAILRRCFRGLWHSSLLRGLESQLKRIQRCSSLLYIHKYINKTKTTIETEYLKVST